jgi:hypothetical protein
MQVTETRAFAIETVFLGGTVLRKLTERVERLAVHTFDKLVFEVNLLTTTVCRELEAGAGH